MIGGSQKLEDITVSYEGLRKNHGVNLIRDSVVSIDVAKKQVKLAGGASLFYDRLIVSPGIDLTLTSCQACWFLMRKIKCCMLGKQASKPWV